MRILSLYLIFFVAVVSAHENRVGQNDLPTIDGTVYDLYGAVITNVRISIENTDTGETISLRTDDNGRYIRRVREGRYRVSMHPSAGYPVGYEHSSFAISSGERVVINFRPRPVSVSDSIDGGHWVENYEGSFPRMVTHFVQQRNGVVKDLRIQYQVLKTNRSTLEYKFAVIASFDRITLYADKVIFQPANGKVIAEGDVLFEDGQHIRKVRRAEIDLLSGSSTIQ